MPIIVIAGQMHCATPRAEFESAEITLKTVLNTGQRLSVKATKIGSPIGVSPLLKKILQ